MGTVLFDADGDGDLDLYLSRGGYESKARYGRYTRISFLSMMAKVIFEMIPSHSRRNFTSKSCVRAIDYDKDGDWIFLLQAEWNHGVIRSRFKFYLSERFARTEK